MAANQVFATVELLESILLDLPMKDLVLLQSMSKTWKGTIECSKHIQKAIYLVSGSMDTAAEDSIVPDTAPNPARSTRAPRHSPSTQCSATTAVKSTIQSSPAWFVTAGCDYILGKPDDLGLQPYAEATASCRQMYVTQPPLRIAIMRVPSDDSTPLSPGRATSYPVVIVDREAKFGGLLDALERVGWGGKTRVVLGIGCSTYEHDLVCLEARDLKAFHGGKTFIAASDFNTPM